MDRVCGGWFCAALATARRRRWRAESRAAARRVGADRRVGAGSRHAGSVQVASRPSRAAAAPLSLRSLSADGGAGWRRRLGCSLEELAQKEVSGMFGNPFFLLYSAHKGAKLAI